jgi:hypothetical protein
MKALTDTDQRLMLADVTVAQANEAVATIARYARDRAELGLFLAMVAPAPHTVEADPAARRALPRKGLEA